MSKGRRLAIILSLGGTVWLAAGVWKFFGLHLDRAQAAVFFVLGALPALMVYGGWVLCALGRVRGRAAVPVWIGSSVVTIDYFILGRPSLGVALQQPFEALFAAWLLVAIWLSIRGLIASGRDRGPEKSALVSGQELGATPAVASALAND